MRSFPWDEIMTLGLGLLRLIPASFWAMTPRELVSAAAALGSVHSPPARASLEALMAQFPDQRSQSIGE